MPIIYLYPNKTNPTSGDLLLVSDISASNQTKKITIGDLKDPLDVVDSLVATLPIQVSGSTGDVTISSRAYSGGATTGYVPTGGSASTFLRGDGTWVTPSGGGGSSYQAGNGIDIDTTTNPDTLNTGLFSNGGLVFNTAKMQVDLAATAMSGELRAVDGGTGQSIYGVGDLLYAETTTTLATVSIGTAGKILSVNSLATSPEWVTNLVGQEVVSGYMLVGNGTSALTQLDTTAKGTIAIGNGATTTTQAVGTDGYYLKARSAESTGVQWATIPVTSFSTGDSERLVTATSASGIQGETNLTFDGSELTVTGTIASGNITSSNGGAPGTGLVRGTYYSQDNTAGLTTTIAVRNGANSASLTFTIKNGLITAIV